MGIFSISHAKSLTQADWTGTVTVGNSAGTSMTAAASDLVLPSDWNSSHFAGLTLSASDIPSAPALIPVYLFNVSSTVNTGSTAAGSWYAQPLYLPYAFNSGNMRFFISAESPCLNAQVISAAGSGSYSRTARLVWTMALYSYSGDNQWSSFYSTDISWLATQTFTKASISTSRMTISNGATFSFPSQYDATGGVTYGSTSQSGTRGISASTAASSAVDSLISTAAAYLSGSMLVQFGISQSLNPGNYVVMVGFNTSQGQTSSTYSGSSNPFFHPRHIFCQAPDVLSYKNPGKSVSTSLAAAHMVGALATTTTGASASVAASNLIAHRLSMYHHLLAGS